MARIFISANSSWNIVNFRAGLVRALHQEGHELYFLTPSGPADEEMCQLHGTHLTLPMKRDSGESLRRYICAFKLSLLHAPLSTFLLFGLHL